MKIYLHSGGSRLKIIRSTTQLTWILLFVWMVLGLTLRLLNLAGKTPSTIELATLIFSLGNSVESVPLNQAISLDTLLQPLQVHNNTGITDVFNHLMTESTHPPSYFILTHLWLKVFPSDGGLANLWAARLLSVCFGVLSIPAIFGLSYLIFNSLIIAHISAALMTFSPYGIYLAQEARHYTFTILFIIASLACFFIGIRYILKQKKLPNIITLTWIVVNGFGIAAHYFFSFNLLVESIILGIFWFKDLQVLKQKIFINTTWRSIYLVALGTIVSGLIWLPFIYNIPDDSITQWLENKLEFVELLAPIGRLLGWLITLLFMLPVEGVNSIIMVISAIILLGFLTWFTPTLITGIKLKIKDLNSRLAIKILLKILIISISIFLICTYIFNKDLTLAARYNFVYFPAFIILVAAGLSVYWQDLNLTTKLPKIQGKKVVIVVILMSFLGALTVSFNYGYQKSRQPELLAAYINNNSKNPVLIASEYKTHSETRALIGLGLEFNKLNPNLSNLKFILSRRDNNDPNTSTKAFYEVLNQLARPLDVWTIDFSPTIDLETNNCLKSDQKRPKIKGYRFRQYHCN